ncbi:Hypothetical protein (Fragment), partial [Durusdinium trenchii]
VVKIRLAQHVAPGWATMELEDRLVDFVGSEIRFLSQFFEHDGLRDYIAYRQGKSLEDDEGRDRNKDAGLVESMWHVVDALCKAEFTGSMRAGEADAKLQALLRGKIKFTVLCAPERDAHGAVVTAEVDFAVELDLEDKIADRADERLQRLRKVMNEMDKKVRSSRGADDAPCDTQILHPRELLAKLISSFDWRRGLSDQTMREGHDQIRCMTCRFLGDDCSVDIGRSKDLRSALRRLPSFLFCTRLLCRRTAPTAPTAEDWRAQTSSFLEAVAQTKGSQCFIRAEVKEEGLSLRIFSRADWLVNAAERLCALASQTEALTLSSLVGPGRQARGLRMDWEKTLEAVHDIPALLKEMLPESATGPGATAESGRLGCVRWCGSDAAHDVTKSSVVPAKVMQETQQIFRSYCALDELLDFVDFLKDFRQHLDSHAHARGPRGGLECPDDVSFRENGAPPLRLLAGPPVSGPPVAVAVAGPATGGTAVAVLQALSGSGGVSGGLGRQMSCPETGFLGWDGPLMRVYQFTMIYPHTDYIVNS